MLHRNGSEKHQRREVNAVPRTLLLNAMEEVRLVNLCRERLVAAEADFEQQQKDCSQMTLKAHRSMGRRHICLCYPGFMLKFGDRALKHRTDSNQCKLPGSSPTLPTFSSMR